MSYCEIKDGIVSVRRSMRWLMDHTKAEDWSVDCDVILSQAYNGLREIELKCLSRKNGKDLSCILKEQN